MSNKTLAAFLALAMIVTAFAILGPSRAPAPLASPSATMRTMVAPTPDMGWTPGTPLEAQTLSNANLGSVALSGTGTGMIVWERDAPRATIMVTPFLPGKGAAGSDWQVPVVLSNGRCYNYAPTVAMDGAGDAIAVWYDTCNYAIHATRFTPSSGWSVPVGIDQPFWLSVNPQIAMNAAGVAFVIWEAWDGSAYHVFSNRFVPGTGWGTAARVEPSANYTGGANVGVDAAGNAIATWYRYDGGTYHVIGARFTLGSGWLAPVMLESSSAYAVYPSVAMDSLGNAVVAWVEFDSGVYNVWANRFDHATGWTGAVNIESQSAWAFIYPGPKVAANNGSAVVTWVMYGPGTDPYSVWANRYVSGVGWGTESDVDGYGGTSYAASSPNVVLDATGNATIVYQVLSLTGTPANMAWNYALRYNARTGAVSAYWQLDYARISPGAPLIALDGSGNALAVWNYNDNPDTTTPARNGINTNRYTFGVGFRYYFQTQVAEWDESLRPGWLQIEANAAGDAIYSWTQLDGPIWNGYAALYTPAMGWTAPTRIENLDFSDVTEEWSAIDGLGNALVLFRTSNGTAYDVYATYYSVRTGWGTPQRLDNAAGSNKYWLRVAMNANGAGIAVWQEYTGTAWNAYAAHFSGTTGTWSAPEAIQSAFTYIGSVAVGLDDAGNAMAAYQAYNGTGYTNYASRYSGGAWGPSVQLTRGPSSGSADVVYLVPMNGAGSVAVAWNEYDGTRWNAFANTYSVASGWGTATKLSSGPGDAFVATPAIGANGDVLDAYQVWDGSQWNVYSVVRPAGGPWGTPVRMNSGAGDAVNILTGIDSRGNGYVAWGQYNGFGYDVVGRRYVSGIGWMSSAVVNSPAPAVPATNTGLTGIAVNGHGDAIVAYNQWENGVLIPFAARYVVGDGLPTLTVASPADGLVTNNASVTVSGMTDPGATIAIDGAPVAMAADGSFSASYSLADGTHTFAIVATDAAGLTRTDSRTVTIDTTAPSLAISTPTTGLLTNNPVAHVTGRTEAGAAVQVNGVNAAVSSSGQFDLSIPLNEGTNVITATATDTAGNSATTSVQVTLDTVAPALVLSSPTPGTTNNPSVVVSGTTEPGATVTVDGTAVTVDPAGKFTTTLTLSSGGNTITVVATDAAGNKASTSVQVSVDTSLPIVTIVLGVLAVAALGLAIMEMIQIRRMRAERAKPPETKPEQPPPPPIGEL